MREQAMRRIPREDITPGGGRRLIVRCDRPGCDYAVLMDPGPLFGARRHWPTAGQSYRFRCRCDHRVTRLSYTDNGEQAEEPISAAAVLRLWF